MADRPVDSAACAPFPSVGEQLVGRSLLREKRGGVEHFVPDQHEALWMQASDFLSGEREDIARMTYVDQMGHAVVLLCSRSGEDDAWRPTWIGRAGFYTKEDARRPPDGFDLSPKMLAALAKARRVETSEELCGHV